MILVLSSLQDVAFTPDGDTIDKFATSPVPVHTTFYLFNLTNADELLIMVANQ